MYRGTMTLKLCFTLLACLLMTSILYESTTLKAAEALQIVYVAADTGGNRDIFLINRDGSGKQNLTNNPAADFAPQISSDGKMLYFISDRSNKRAMYAMDVESKTIIEVPIKFNPKPNAYVPMDPMDPVGFCRFVVPQLSPDNSSIAFVSNRQGEGSLVNIAKIDGSQQKKYKTQTGQYISDIVWSPNSSMVALHLSDAQTNVGPNIGEIWILDTKKEMTRKVADVSREKKDEWQRNYGAESGYNSYSFTGIKWSPDGKYISFATLDSSGRFSADGPGITSPQIKKDDAWILLQRGYVPSWSSDSTRLIFSGYRGDGPTYGLEGTVVYSLRDKKATVLSTTSGNDYAWSPDNTKITFWKAYSEQPELVTVTVDNGSEQLVTIKQNSKLDYIIDEQSGCYSSDLYGSQMAKVVWSTDSSQILVLSGASLYAMDALGIDIVPLAENVSEALWGVQ